MANALIDASPVTASTSSQLSTADRWDHFLARIGVRRMGHLVVPGLYTLGRPTSDSPVFVSANYTLSFDALRSSLQNIDGYILVLDTKGVNVWCAAGEGTFGTDELVNRIDQTGLSGVVAHRTVIVPQLGAPGVSAHEVKRRSGFKVEYGPVRASDLQPYLRNRTATPAMRLVQFPLRDRLAVTVVDLVVALLPMLIAAVVLYFIGGWWQSAAVISAILAGALVFPILLPYIPTNKFSTKGFIVGGIVALPFAIHAFMGNPQEAIWLRLSDGLSNLLALTAITAYLSLLFTGSTTFTSRTGVKREIATYFPIMAWMFVIGVILAVVVVIGRMVGG